MRLEGWQRVNPWLHPSRRLLRKLLGMRPKQTLLIMRNKMRASLNKDNQNDRC
jgi:hypothetical protein